MSTTRLVDDPVAAPLAARPFDAPGWRRFVVAVAWFAAAAPLAVALLLYVGFPAFGFDLERFQDADYVLGAFRAHRGLVFFGVPLLGVPTIAASGVVAAAAGGALGGRDRVAGAVGGGVAALGFLVMMSFEILEQAAYVQLPMAGFAADSARGAFAAVTIAGRHFFAWGALFAGAGLGALARAAWRPWGAGPALAAATAALAGVAFFVVSAIVAAPTGGVAYNASYVVFSLALSAWHLGCARRLARG